MSKTTRIFESTLVDDLEGVRSRLEQRFVQGGSVLEEVVGALGSLIGMLEKTSDSLNEQAAAEATSHLGQAAKRLKAMPAADGERRARLSSISQTGKSLAGYARSMEETLRYLRTFAMTAKITGAQIPDFSAFAAELVERIQFATNEVQKLSDQIASLEDTINIAAGGDAGSLQAHFDKIPAIVERLMNNARLINAQRDELGSMAEAVTALGRKIEMKVAQTLSAMQIGDITRQRIEHCQAAYAIADDHFSSSGKGEPGAGAGRDAVARRIDQLVFALLDQAAADFNKDTTRIVKNIASFSSDIDALANLFGMMLAADDTEGGRTPMSLLRDDLLLAQSIAEEITTAVGRTIDLSAGAVDTVRTLVSGVQAIQLVRRDIQYMALNTNLRCSKLGEEARGINVVTVELRSYSALLDEDAESTLSGLSQLEKDATVLGGRGDEGSQSSLPPLGSFIGAALAHVENANTSMMSGREALRSSGKEITAKVKSASSKLDFTSGIGDMLSACLERAKVQGNDAGSIPDDCHEALKAISRRIAQTFTMASEREILARVFGQDAVAGTNESSASNDADELFADALF